MNGAPSASVMSTWLKGSKGGGIKNIADAGESFGSEVEMDVVTPRTLGTPRPCRAAPHFPGGADLRE